MGPPLGYQLRILGISLILTAVFIGWASLALMGLTQIFGILVGLLIAFILMQVSSSLAIIAGVVMAFWGAYAVMHYHWFLSLLAAVPVIPLGIASLLLRGTYDLLKFPFKKKEPESKTGKN